jgi:arylsulfatase A-like enzyme
VVTRALAWLDQHRGRRFFLWVHLFEPHAPYGAPGDGRATAARDDDEVAEADRQIGRVLEGLGNEADATIVVVTADHGEAFGEHGELTHSLFVYDTTLHVPLIVAGPGVRAGTIDEAVSLVDVAPTAARLLGAGGFDADGVDLGPALRGATPAPRTLYAESFAPLLDFGWSPLRSVREAGWKLIDAPRPELYDVARDPGERTDRAAGSPTPSSPLP